MHQGFKHERKNTSSSLRPDWSRRGAWFSPAARSMLALELKTQETEISLTGSKNPVSRVIWASPHGLSAPRFLECLPPSADTGQMPAESRWVANNAQLTSTGTVWSLASDAEWPYSDPKTTRRPHYEARPASTVPLVFTRSDSSLRWFADGFLVAHTCRICDNSSLAVGHRHIDESKRPCTKGDLALLSL